MQISPDPDDVEYLAVALSLGCAIWSKDSDLKEKQSRVNVFSTSDLISFLGYIKYSFYLFRTQIYTDLRRKLFPQIIKCLTFNFRFSAKIKLNLKS